MKAETIRKFISCNFCLSTCFFFSPPTSLYFPIWMDDQGWLRAFNETAHTLKLNCWVTLPNSGKRSHNKVYSVTGHILSHCRVHSMPYIWTAFGSLTLLFYSYSLVACIFTCHLCSQVCIHKFYKNGKSRVVQLSRVFLWVAAISRDTRA